MAGDECLPIKRKGRIDQVNEDFSDFSLSSPARKIRRLDVDLPPIMEEEEIEMAMQDTGAKELEPAPVNEERAIVLFKPLHSHQSSTGRLFVDRDLISGFRNRFLCDASLVNNNNDEDNKSNKCQVVVCWNPSQSPYLQSTEAFQQPHTLQITELDETGEDAVMEEAAMEIKEPQQELSSYGFGRASGTEGFHQWQQQQQCMTTIPQPPQVNNTPITWFSSA